MLCPSKRRAFPSAVFALPLYLYHPFSDYFFLSLLLYVSIMLFLASLSLFPSLSTVMCLFVSLLQLISLSPSHISLPLALPPSNSPTSPTFHTLSPCLGLNLNSQAAPATLPRTTPRCDLCATPELIERSPRIAS